MEGRQTIEDEINGLVKRSAFKQCYERLAGIRIRYPKSSYYEVLELYVKYKHLPAQFDIQKLLVEPFAKDKTTSKKITNDLRTLDLLFRMLVQMNHHDDAVTVLELAHAKFGGWELAYDFFDKSLQCFDYRRMIEASAALCSYSQDVESNTRMFNFWNAIATIAYFRYQKNRVTSQEAKILPRLSFERLEKLKPFQSEQEAIIYCTVCDELLEDQEIDPQIILPRLENSLDLYMKGFMLKHVKDPQVLFDTCLQLLHKIDDYKLLQKLITSGHELGKTGEELKETITKAVGDSRNGRLSWLEIDLSYSKDKKVSKESLIHYLTKFHNKSCCELDITTYKEYINNDMLNDAMQSLPHDDVIHDSNLFKLRLSTNSAIELYQRHRDSMKKKSKTDYSSNATFILDIVEEVLSKEKKTLLDNLLAVTILENYQQRDPHNFQTATFLTQLYMELGFPTLAHLVYKQVKIKNVQVDSMDHILYTRIGSIFPNKQHEMIQNDLSDHMRTYYNINDKLSQFIRIAMERKSYSKIEGMIDLKGKLTESVTRWIIMGERLEMSRLYSDKKQRTTLLNEFHEEWDLMLHCAKMNGKIKDDVFSDNRDMTFTNHNFQYENVDMSWIIFKVIKEFMLESIPNGANKDKIAALLESVSEIEDNKTATTMEKWSFKLISSIYHDDMDEVKKLLENIPTHDSANENWLLIHDYLTQLNTLKTIFTFKKCQPVKYIIQTHLKQLRDNCDDIFLRYRNHINSTLPQVNSHPVMAQLDFQPMPESMFLDSMLVVQKFVRNL